MTNKKFREQNSFNAQQTELPQSVESIQILQERNKYWAMDIDRATDRVFLMLLLLKFGLADGMQKFLKRCKASNYPVKQI